MDYKEKLKTIINSNKTPFVDIDTFLKYFPELKESEDEKIRNHLISLFEKFITLGVANECETSEIKIDDIIAYLEKLGNINPTEDELEALRMAAYEPTKNWSEKLQSLYEKLACCE